MKYRDRLMLPLLACLPLVSHASTTAGGWPSRPVRLVVPFSAGGATDSVARLLANQLNAAWDQAVVVDNKPGSGTILGTDTVAKAPADGYTLGVVVSSHAINPSLRNKLPYDTLRDFAPVSEIGVQHMVIAANPALPANNLAELIALAKQQPGKLSYASPGTGTALHLGMELLKVQAGLDILHVPYKGGAPAQQDVMGGQVPLLLDIYHSAAPLIKAGRLKPIALLSPQRPPSIPDIPAVIETVPGVSALSSIGIVAPAGTPAAVIRKARTDIATLLANKAFAQQFRDMGVDPVASTPEDFDRRIRADIAKWAPVVKASGATID